MSIQVLHRDDLELGGFAGLREHRLVMDSKVFGSHIESGVWSGLGSFVYLADAKFIPHGETKLHPHKEIDVVSVIVDGRIAHKGTLEEGNILESNKVQVQRAGGEGFAHNEVNPDDSENRMIQLWFTPEKSGEAADYRLYTLQQGQMTQVYGGDQEQNQTIPSKTIMQVGLLESNQTILLSGKFIAYLIKGSGKINQSKISSGDLFKGQDETFESLENSELIVITA